MASRPFICSVYIPNETRPLSHGITAINWFLRYTIRNAAVKSWHNSRLLVPSIYRTNAGVKSWHNGRLLVPSIYRTKRGRLVMASLLFICSFYIPNETQPLSHGITAVYLFLLCTERNATVKSWHNGLLLVPSMYRTKRDR